jgi:hypothetical protein
MIPRFGSGGRNVNPGRADEVFAEHADFSPTSMLHCLTMLRFCGSGCQPTSGNSRRCPRSLHRQQQSFRQATYRRIASSISRAV